jgi:UDP-glucose 4-epimerase
MKVAVTGGSGFVGQHVINLLTDKQYEVLNIDRISKSIPNTVLLDIAESDVNFLAEILKDVDTVYHLAARARVPASWTTPHLYVKDNITATLNILEACKIAKVKKFVMTGSSTVYGDRRGSFKETHSPDPINPYAVTKLAAENLVLLYADHFKVNIARLFNVFGDNFPVTEDATSIGRFTWCKQNGYPIELYGENKRRDFVFVQDVVRALHMISRQAESKEIFNVGSGISTPIRSIAEFFSDNVVEKSHRLGDADETLANIDKIKSQLGWTPTIRVTDWLKENVT